MISAVHYELIESEIQNQKQQEICCEIERNTNTTVQLTFLRSDGRVCDKEAKEGGGEGETIQKFCHLQVKHFFTFCHPFSPFATCKCNAHLR